MIRIRVSIALAAAMLSLPATALAQRPAARSERATIVAAAVHQGEISSTQGACLTVNISTVDSGYASLTWPAKLSKRCAAVAANGEIVEQKSGDGWTVAAAGSSFACPLNTVPAAVASDLGICAGPAAVIGASHSDGPRHFHHQHGRR